MADEKEFPRGQLNKDDEGALTVGFTSTKGTVVIHFGKPITWIGLGPADARAWAEKLVELADKVEKSAH